MNFIENLKWRGLFSQMTPDLGEELEKGMCVAYIGYDPTAPSLTIGNLVTIMLLKHFQLAGHKPIVLMGGATGRIGDPSGKDQERQLKPLEVLDANLERQKLQFYQLLDFSDDLPNRAEIVNNLDFYKDMNVLDFLRNVGKTLTVNYMMSKESVKKRIETGISFTEFSYQLLQGYDFQVLYETKNCTLQMGGSDQWGNIVSGTEMVRKNIGGNAHGLTCPLLLKADGKKFGKSEDGNVWLSADLTSPYKFYQFWINTSDEDIVKSNRIFSLQSQAEIEALEAEHAAAPHLRILQKSLAEELTIRIHSEEDYQDVLEVSELLFNKNFTKESLVKMTEKSLATVAEEIPHFIIEKAAIQAGISVSDLLTGNVFTSKSEARRAVQGNALAINKDKITDHDQIVTADSLLADKFILIENGKKQKAILVAH